MGCGIYWQQVHETEKWLSMAEQFTVSKTDPGYLAAERRRGALLAQIGYKFPRSWEVMKQTSVLGRLETLGLEYAARSPGFTKEELKDAVIKVWWEPEGGWMSEARFKPGGAPIYRHLTDEEGFTFMKGKETGELIAKVFEEDEYLGE